MVTVGVLSPGAMGSAVGRAYAAGGSRVVTATAGRSPRTARLAAAAGLEVLADLDAVVAASDVVLSVVPPGEASALATALAAAARRTGAAPLVVEANAVSPATVAQVAAELAAAGLDVVDGAVSGGPPQPGEDPPTRLYLSGPRAAQVAAVAVRDLDVRVVGPALGTASAVKMCTASYYKGRTALAAHALLTAHAHGVVDVVLDDLGGLAPSARSVGTAASKAWRYVDEMREIAATQGAAGLPPELFAAMAVVFAGLAERGDGTQPEDVPADLSWPALLDRLGGERPAPQRRGHERPPP